MVMQKVLYTVEEAGEMCSMSRDSIYAYMKQKVLRSVKNGRSRLIPAKALPEFVEWLEANQPGDDLE